MMEIIWVQSREGYRGRQSTFLAIMPEVPEARIMAPLQILVSSTNVHI